MRDSLHIASLHHYPLKSAQGISLTQAQMNPSGLEQDRRWVLIDEAGKFLSQRACAAMGAIYVVAHAQQLTIHFHGQTHIAIANPEHLNAAIVWDDLVENCFAVQPKIDTWLSHALGVSVRLFYCPDTQQQTDGFLRFLAASRRKADGKVYLGQNAVLRHAIHSTGCAPIDDVLTSDAISHTQSLAETRGLLHTKKEHLKDAPDFEDFIQPILIVGQEVWVES
jgi:uncharacterized protein YcbX